MYEEALQIAEKRRKIKNKGEKKRYTQLNAEFQRKAKKAKKTFLNEKCREVEENKRMLLLLFQFGFLLFLFLL